MKRILELENNLSQLSGLLDTTGDFLDKHKVPVPVQYKIKLILDEMFSKHRLLRVQTGRPPTRSALKCV